MPSPQLGSLLLVPSTVLGACMGPAWKMHGGIHESTLVPGQCSGPKPAGRPGLQPGDTNGKSF